ncbi:MAG: prolipoprotein diacylglyceryl transferase, partial [Cyclobacteriaceae bacterium]
MDNFFNYVVWAPNPEIFSFFFLEVRWYGLLFALSFILALQIMYLIFKREKKPLKDVETLAIYMIIASIIGARLGHVFFYEPSLYLTDPLKILKIWEGGLAAFGAAIGIIIAVLLYKNYFIKVSFNTFKIKKINRVGQSYLWITDRIVIAAALIACFVKVGNLINSELFGEPT